MEDDALRLKQVFPDAFPSWQRRSLIAAFVILTLSAPRSAPAEEAASAPAALAAPQASPVIRDEAAHGAAKGIATETIEITKSAASWDNLSELFFGNTPAAPFGEGSVFVMRGELRNSGAKSVHHVLLRYELLDENGKVLEDAEGFNRSAEGMRPDEEGQVHTEQVKAIPAGGVDSYRMVFFHDEVPRFKSQRVRVVEVHEEK